MTPNHLTTENVNLMGLSTGRARASLNWRDERPKNFMHAYYLEFVQTNWEPTYLPRQVRLIPQPQQPSSSGGSGGGGGGGGAIVIMCAVVALAIIYQ